jgi:hypothetical protein
MGGRRLRGYAVGTSVAFLVLVVWLIDRTSQERAREATWETRLRRAEDARRHDLDKLHRETAEVARLSQALGQARSVLAASADGGDNPFEDALGSWLGRINRLNAFLGQHPEWSIPELRGLTANDWLDATKNANLVTEADYREALASLRSLAKRNSAPKIEDALRRCLAANHGALPADAQALAGYLPDGLDPALLQRYRMNPSGQVKGLRGDLHFVLVETNPVDPLWDSSFFYSETGGYGTRAAFNDAAAAVTSAVDRFQQSNGRPPTDVSQIGPFLQRTIDPSRLAATFTALTTKPSLPAGRGGGN